MSKKTLEASQWTPVSYSLLAGAVSGSTVDLALFPLDTLKTRLQSKQGFIKSGGFARIYSGISTTLIASAPSAALFFACYDTIKNALDHLDSPHRFHTHMIAATMGETAACLIRVPMDIIKQRLQVGIARNLSQAAQDIYKANGTPGFYRGFQMTMFREIPFACIQFPLYEQFKLRFVERNSKFASLQASLCGMVAGGIAAAITTPLDVMKTRIMLTTKKGQTPSMNIIFNEIRNEGSAKFFSGIVPRVFWISVGGSIFLGTYEFTHQFLVNG